jgi:hypothetical protein
LQGEIEMAHDTVFPNLDGFEPTRQTLQLYSRVITAVPRAHGEFHPKWWHVSLEVQPEGLITDAVVLPEGGSLWFKMDLVNHEILLLVEGNVVTTFPLSAARSVTSLAQDVFTVVSRFGLPESYDWSKFENDEPRVYDPDQVQSFLTALVHADRIFKAHRAHLSGDIGPVQLWPHGFDLAFEWFGTRVEVYEEHGERQEYPSQLNLGFFPGSPDGEPYFYSNPWPFEADFLLDQPLPKGATWHTEGWQGAFLPYAELVGDPNAAERLRDFAWRVYEISAPTLRADWATVSGKDAS